MTELYAKESLLYRADNVSVSVLEEFFLQFHYFHDKKKKYLLRLDRDYFL